MAQATNPESTHASLLKAPHWRATLPLFLANLCVVTLAYYPLSTPHFATDSYPAFYDLSPETPANLGRLLTALIAWIFERIGFYPIVYQSAFTWLLIIVVALCSTIVLQRLRRELAVTRVEEGAATAWIVGEIALAAAVLIAFVNVALLEWFLFPEVTLYFTLALLLSVLAFEVWSWGHSWWVIVGVCALLYAALNFYQAALGFFVIPALIVVIVRHRSTPEWPAWRDGIFVVAIGAVCAIANLAVTQVGIQMGWLIREVRNPGLTYENVRHSIEPVLAGIAEMWDSFFTLMPPSVISLMTIALVVILLLGATLGQYSWSRLIMPAVALVLGVAIVYAPHLITAVVWITPRSIAPIFALYTLLIVCVLMLSHDRFSTIVVGVLAIAFVSISIWQIHAITASHHAHNKIEQREARTIVDEIEDYERKTGTQIQRVGIVLDDETTWNYAGETGVEYVFHDLNVRSMTRTWSDLAILHFVSGRHFLRLEVSDEKRAQLLSETPNWIEFDADDQVSFEGDTAYIVVY